MPPKKTTPKKTERGATRKKSAVKKAVRRTKPAAAAVETKVVAPVAIDVEATTRTKGRRSAKPVADVAAATVVAAPPVAPEVEADADQIVIRFPPVAPSPFPPINKPAAPAVVAPAAPKPREAPPERAAPAARRDEAPRRDDRRDDAPRRDDRRDDHRGGERAPRRDDRRRDWDDRPADRGDRRPDREDRPPERDDRRRDRDDRGPSRDERGPVRDDRGPYRDDRGPARDERGPARDDRAPYRDDRGPVHDDRGGPPGEGGEGLSRSKRRRMRRRRRHGPGDDGAQPHGPSAGAPLDDHDLHDDEHLDHEPAAELRGVVNGDDEESEAAPWLNAAESIRAELSHAATLDDLVEGDRPVELLEDDDPGREVEVDEDDSDDVDESDERGAVAVGDEAEEDEDGAAAQARGEGRRRGRRGRRRGRRDRRDEREVGVEASEASPLRRGAREMIINAIPREECRIAILNNGRLEEIYMERATAENHVGNIYKGVVINVEPSIQAAFIDFGHGKNGFLHISDLHTQYFPDGQQHAEQVGQKMPRRSRPPIQKCLRRGQELICQVTKEGIGTKGPTLTTYISIPGRFLVMMPGMGKLGVSRRIEDDQLRDQLRDKLSELDPPEGMGIIGRTAALDRTREELQNDLEYLTRLWRAVDNRIRNEPAPAELYREQDLVIRTIRDIFTDDIQRLLVDDPDVAQRARNFLSIFSPEAADRIQVFEDPEPIFHKFGIEDELERIHSRRVALPSGGSLVIEPTEALVAIDVNSGKFRTEDDPEASAFKINMEAADEIARQLRLRDLGGLIVCDFIDMRMESHRREIERRLARSLRDHKERAKVLRTSEFGLIELTRQRQRASLTRSIYQDCRHCQGTGLVKTVESVALDVMRLVQLAVTRQHIQSVEVSVSPDVAFLLQNRKRRLLYELEHNHRRVISVRPDPSFSLDQVEIRCTDARGRLVPHT